MSALRSLTKPMKVWFEIPLRKIEYNRGNLTPIEDDIDGYFEINRVYYIYDVPGGSERAGHAHVSLEQIYISLAGSFDVHLENELTSETITLNRPNIGLWIGPGVWRVIDNFSSGAVCLALASAKYDESDYQSRIEQRVGGIPGLFNALD